MLEHSYALKDQVTDDPARGREADGCLGGKVTSLPGEN